MENHSYLQPIQSAPLEPGSSGAREPETAGAIEFWRILRRRKGALILAGLAGALTGFLLTLPQQPIYQAHTSIEIVGVNDNFLNTKQVVPVTETGTTSETADIQTQIKILLSESLLGRVLDKLMGDRPFDLMGERFGWLWRRVFQVPEPSPAARREDALKSAQRGVRVYATGPTRILEITADSADPRVAAQFANTLASEFISQNLEARWKTNEHIHQWLTRQLEETRVKLERSEDMLQAYARESSLIFTTEQVSLAEGKLGRLQQNLSAAQAERIAKQSRYETAVASPPEALPDVLNNDALRDYQAKLTELRRQIAELDATYTPEHPKMMRVQAQLATLESALKRERAEVISRIGNEFQEAKRREALIAKAGFAQARQVGIDSEKAIRYNILKRDVDSNRQLYDTMLQQLKQSAIGAATRASNVRVVDPARIPTRPYKPDRVLSSGLGLLTGLLLGVSLILVRACGDRSLRQPGDSPVCLNVPELGVIPSDSAGTVARRLARLGVRKRKAGGSGRNGNAGAGRALEDRVELITWQRKPSPIAASFRSVLMSILFAGESDNLPKIMVVTSAGPGEGKSTVVSNLGIAIAELGRKVLLIDADLHKPRLQEIFGMANDRGLSDVLREPNAVTRGGILNGLIGKTEVPGLCLLTSGPGAAVTTNLLYGFPMVELLKRLGEEFGTILIDTPPLLQLPDARVMGRIAGGVILVVRSGKTSSDDALATRQRLSEDGVEILGTVLNDWKPESALNRNNGYHGAAYKSVRKSYASRSAHA